jgi:uncharacterized protein YjiS (DUF1127 family)
MAVEYRNLQGELATGRALSRRDVELAATMARAEAFADFFIAAGRLVRAAAGWAIARWRDAGVRAELESLTDRELADIGLRRCDVRRRDLGELAREWAAPVAPTAANRNEAPRRAA